MIVFDASSLVGAAIGADSVPRRAVQEARMQDRFCTSRAVFDEVVEVLHRPRLARFVDPALRDDLLDLLIPGAAWFEPAERIADCRDTKDNKYLELALAASASTIVSSEGPACASPVAWGAAPEAGGVSGDFTRKLLTRRYAHPAEAPLQRRPAPWPRQVPCRRDGPI